MESPQRSQSTLDLAWEAGLGFEGSLSFDRRWDGCPQMCRIRVDSCLNNLPQSEQQKVRDPEWVAMCLEIGWC